MTNDRAHIVFVSHTPEFREHPVGRTFMGAAEAAVVEARMTTTDMAYFVEREGSRAAECIDEVRKADVYVALIGPWYGSTVEDRPECSLVEVEFEAATERGIPRFVFILADDATIDAPPPAESTDDRQQEFRRRILQDAGVIAMKFSSPDQLQHEVFKALASHRARRASGPTLARPWLGRPSTLGAGFIGRDALVTRTREALGTSRIVVAYGEPGSGKSQLAAEVTHHIGDAGLWTVCAATIEGTLASLAPALDVDTTSSEQQRAARVVTQLHAMPPDTLLVIDHVESLDLVHAMLREIGAARLLVTTRDSRIHLLPPGTAAIYLAPLDDTDAVALLRSRGYQESGDRPLREIARALGGLPLALESVAISLGIPGTDAQDLLATLREGANAIELPALHDGAGHGIDATSVHEAFTGTLARLPAELRTRIAPLAYLADAPAPLAFLGVITEATGEARRELIAALQRETVLRIEGLRGSVHPLFVAAIDATNADDSLARALPLFARRLQALLDDPQAFKVERIHFNRFLHVLESRLDASDPERLAYQQHLAAAHAALAADPESAREQTPPA